jgi:hypothetical protein
MNIDVVKLLMLIRVENQDDLLPVVESEGWHTVQDLFRKTGTLYNRDWNGKFVLDQDERPWKATDEELASLNRLQGKVVVISEGKYHISTQVPVYKDRDGSVYVAEADLSRFLSKIGLTQ